MSLLLIFGHWLDFHQMVFASVASEHVELNLFDFGMALGFVGIIMLVTGRVLSKYPMVEKIILSSKKVLFIIPNPVIGA